MVVRLALLAVSFGLRSRPSAVGSLLSPGCSPSPSAWFRRSALGSSTSCANTACGNGSTYWTASVAHEIVRRSIGSQGSARESRKKFVSTDPRHALGAGSARIISSVPKSPLAKRRYGGPTRACRSLGRISPETEGCATVCCAEAWRAKANRGFQPRARQLTPSADWNIHACRRPARASQAAHCW